MVSNNLLLLLSLLQGTATCAPGTNTHLHLTSLTSYHAQETHRTLGKPQLTALPATLLQQPMF
jgi:hypothetical protein